MKFPERSITQCRHGADVTIEISTSWNADRTAMTVTATMRDCRRCLDEAAAGMVAIAIGQEEKR